MTEDATALPAVEVEEEVDPIEEFADREVGTETRHEVRGDGSIAYFSDAEDTDADRERAAQGIPAREIGTSPRGPRA